MPYIPSAVNYYEYIQSDAWKAKRLAALERAGWCCQLCRSTVCLNVHHNTYQRLGRELDTDLVALCEACHDVFHARRDPRTRDDDNDFEPCHALHSPPRQAQHGQRANHPEPPSSRFARTFADLSREDKNKIITEWRGSPDGARERLSVKWGCSRSTMDRVWAEYHGGEWQKKQARVFRRRRR